MKLFRAKYALHPDSRLSYVDPLQYVVAEDFTEAFRLASKHLPKNAGVLKTVEHVSDEVVL